MEQQHSAGARLAQLEQRVRVLEDVNAIRHLKARSRTCALRIIFRDLSQAVCVV